MNTNYIGKRKDTGHGGVGPMTKQELIKSVMEVRKVSSGILSNGYGTARKSSDYYFGL